MFSYPLLRLSVPCLRVALPLDRSLSCSMSDTTPPYLALGDLPAVDHEVGAARAEEERKSAPQVCVLPVEELHFFCSARLSFSLFSLLLLLLFLLSLSREYFSKGGLAPYRCTAVSSPRASVWYCGGECFFSFVGPLAWRALWFSSLFLSPPPLPLSVSLPAWRPSPVPCLLCLSCSASSRWKRRLSCRADGRDPTRVFSLSFSLLLFPFSLLSPLFSFLSLSLLSPSPSLSATSLFCRSIGTPSLSPLPPPLSPPPLTSSSLVASFRSTPASNAILRLAPSPKTLRGCPRVTSST